MPINLSSNFELSAQLPLDHRTVAATIAVRNAIPTIQRFQGLVCYVRTGSSGGPENWQLQGGIANSNWVLIGGAGGVAVTRYISPTGSNSADGLTALTPWQTPAYAITQIIALAPSSATINCANGTYTGVAFDSPAIKFNCDITFAGNEASPSSVVFQNTSTTTIVGVFSSSSIIRFHGIKFVGGGSNAAVYQEGGDVYLRNCLGESFANFATMTGVGSRFYVQGGLVDLGITDTDIGFSISNGASLYIDNNVELTQNGSSPNQGILYSISNGNFVPVGNNTHTLNCVPITGAGWIFSAGNAFIYTGSFCLYEINDGSGLGDFTDCLIASGNNCRYTLNATSGWMELKYNSILYDNATCAWWASGAPLNEIVLSNGGQIISPNYVNLGTYPIGLIGDDIVDYVEYGTDETRTKYALDARYYDTITFSCFGELPRGITTNDLSPKGTSSVPYQIYIAKAKSEIVSITVRTRIANSSLLVVTDTYTVYKNNSSTAMFVDVTTTNNATSTAAPVPIASGDYLSVRVTTDALTSAEDVTVSVVIRRLG
jgi:hypothetical protein